MSTNMKIWIKRILLTVVALVVGVIVWAATWPIKGDPIIPPDEVGAGASSVEPSFTGLQREFPALNEPDDNPASPAKVALGRMLFFDPVLSAENDMACATCHHPDMGFGDGRAVAMGAGGTGVGPQRQGGVALSRNAPNLWNIGYQPALFWDGRQPTLEAQALEPLTNPEEMGVTDLNDLVDELIAIPEYTVLFNAAFGGGEESITADNIARALATFQRSLISNNSPFDLYAAGQFDALTPPQRRGLTLFRSAATRCFECHAAPTFASNTFRIIGVPSDDPGRSGVADDAPDGAFRVPTLRNVALTAPYMHNGSLATLEEVVEFYADGGGRIHDMPDMDNFVRGFDLSTQEKADLVEFLYALTDESQLPAIPDAVPSGLPVITPITNPVRDLIAQHTATPSGAGIPERAPMTITVAEGELIQAAVDRALPGDTILVPYGEYHERVVIDMSDITFMGIPNEDGEWPILDGDNEMADGIIGSGNNFEVAFFHVRNFTDNGILAEGVTNLYMHDLIADHTGVYGIYPVRSTTVLVERVTAYGLNDAGVYAGQCEDVIVRDSVAYENVIGIEIENSIGSEVYDNHVYDNTVGILYDLLPRLNSKDSAGGKIYNNLMEHNNLDNFAPEGATAAVIPPGLGMLILASNENEVYDNEIRDNKTGGIAVFNLAIAYEPDRIDVGPNPENNWIHDNTLVNNGYDIPESVAKMGVTGADIIWDGTGFGNEFDQPDATMFPLPTLPSSSWPLPVQKLFYRTLQLLITLTS